MGASEKQGSLAQTAGTSARIKVQDCSDLGALPFRDPRFDHLLLNRRPNLDVPKKLDNLKFHTLVGKRA